MNFREESDLWELFFQFDGAKFVQKRMYRAEIRYLNLLSVMESEGYGMSDSLYYVKHEGEGLNGLALVDSNLKVEEMVRKYELSKKLVLTVMRDKRIQSIVVSPVKKKPSVHVDLDTKDQDTQIDEHIPVDFLTQDSVYYGNKQAEEEMAAEEEYSSDDGWAYPCQVVPEEEEERRRREDEELYKLIEEMRRMKNDPLLHYEGETDIEDIFDIQEEPEFLAARNTTRCREVVEKLPTRCREVVETLLLT